MIAALDADIIAYRAAFGSAMTKVDFEDGEDPTEYVDVQRGIEGCDELIQEWFDLSGCDSFVCVLSSKENFRKLIAPTYKANRTAPKPQGLDEIMEHIKTKYPTIIWRGLEADDTIGVLVTDRWSGLNYVGVSIDKDFNTLSGLLFNPTKDEKVWINSKDDAEYNHCVQWLTGDSTDNYKGIPGIGPKKAEKLLEKGRVQQGSWADFIQTLYKEADLSPEYCLEQRLMSRILTNKHYDQVTGEILLDDGDNKWRTLDEIEAKFKELG